MKKIIFPAIILVAMGAVLSNVLEVNACNPNNTVGYNCNFDRTTVLTRLVTNKNNTSVQLNAAYVSGDYYDPSCRGYFDLGNAYSQTQRIWFGPISKTNTVTYFSSTAANLTPNTIYYYRAGVACDSGETSGGLVAFNSNIPAPVNYVKKNVTYVAPKVAPKVTTKTVSAPAKNVEKVSAPIVRNYDNKLTVSLESLEPTIVPGGQAAFKLVFKNVGNTDITNLNFQVELSNGLTIESASVGQPNKGAKIFDVNIKQLGDDMGGEIILLTNISKTAKVGDKLTLNTTANYNYANVKAETKTSTAVFVNEEAPQTALDRSNNWQPRTLLEWIITFLVLAAFIAAVRVVVKAFKKV